MKGIPVTIHAPYNGLTERLCNLATALLEELESLHKAMAKLVALNVVPSTADIHHRGVVSPTHLIIIALAAEQNAEVDPSWHRLVLLRLRTFENSLHQLCVQTLDVGSPLLVWHLRPRLTVAFGSGLQLQDEGEAIEIAVEVLYVVVAAAEKPVKVVQRADSDVEFRDEALAAGREEAHAVVNRWHHFGRRLGDLEVVLAVENCLGFVEHFLAGEEDVDVGSSEV